MINQFWQVNKDHCFGASEVALYFHLLNVCNTKNWENPYTHNNIKVCAAIGLSEKTIKKAKDKLVSAGLIKYKSGKNKKEHTIYTMVVKIPTNRGTNPTTKGITNDSNININLNRNYIYIQQEQIFEIEDWFEERFKLQKENWQQLYPLANINHCLKEFFLKKSHETFKDLSHFRNSFALELKYTHNKNQKEKNSGQKEKGSKAQSLLEQDRILREGHG